MKNVFLDFKTCLILFALLLFLSVSSYAQIAINTDGSSPDASAMLDVKSSSKGLLIPRMTTTQRNTLAATAVAGLMVYDTDLNKFFFFDGSLWREGSVGNLWTRTSTYTNLSNAGDKIGIGTSVPLYKVDMNLSDGSAFYRAKSTYGYAGLFIDKANAGANAYIGYYTGGAYKWFVGMIDDNNFSISRDYNTPDGKFYIDSTGLVGIGTNAPTAELEVANATGQPDIRITRPSTSYAAALSFYTGSTSEWNFLTASGNTNMLLYRGSGNTTGNLGLMHSGGSVGIGTTSPARTFEVVSSDWKSARISSSYPGAFLEFKGTNSTNWAFGTYGGSARLLSTVNDFTNTTDEYWFSTSAFFPFTNDARTLGTTGNRWSTLYSVAGNFSGDVAIGNTFATGYKLSVSGKIICEELRVNAVADWPDYVFGKEYKLMSLQSLEKFIEDNHHLPGVPSSGEVEESGMDVGETQRLMMEKIEELTLYLIRQQKEIETLKEQLNKQTDHE